MVLALTSLPQDVLILICAHLLVEDVLSVMQTCRVMYGIGSSDYLWRTLLSDWDIPLNIPLNASLTSLSSNSLREAAVKSLRLDTKWRDPRLEMRHAQCVIPRNSSFVDGMCLLPGGHWLVTLQCEQTARTHVTLWSTRDLNDCRLIFRIPVVGRVRALHAHHHHELEQVTIGIAFARDTAESIQVYNVSLQDDSSTRYTLVFEAMPNELHAVGQIAGMKIDGEIMIVTFAPLAPSTDNEGQIVCVNLVSRVTVALECPDWLFAWGRLKIFQRYFAVTTSHYTLLHTTARISFYELPSVIFEHADCLPSSMPCWPERLVIRSSLTADTTWRSDHPLVLELSDDVLSNSAKSCGFSMFGRPIRSPHTDVETLGIDVVRVSFDGKNIDCVSTTVPCHAVPSVGEVRVSSSGRRAVWLSPGPDTHECTLMKFALGRTGDRSESCISTLMASFSGLPFNPRDFHSFVFDESSCKIGVALPSGELYMLHFEC